jgi:phosphatidylglycerophosphate synthase
LTYLAKVLACLLVIGAIAVVGRKRSHPFPRFGPANQVTAARSALVALVAAFIGEPTTTASAHAIVTISLLATVLDGLDGWLARRSGLASAFGARFDMEVDALLILVLAILVWQYDRAGAWVVLSGLLRYLFVAAGWALPWMARPLLPSVRRQAICVVQIGGLLLAMTPVVPRPIAAALAAVSLAALAGSFLIDSLWLWRSHRRQQVA